MMRNVQGTRHIYNNSLCAKAGFIILLFTLISAGVFSQEKLSENIRLNQMGFYPNAPKHAVVLSVNSNDFYLAAVPSKGEIKTENFKKVYSGKLKDPVQSPFSSKQGRIADFSSFTKPGKYILVVPGVGYSYTFEIRASVHDALSRASIKNYYYQRMSVPLVEKYSGKWKRPSSHPDTEVLVHASAATASRPEGTKISSPRGWYDAGDYNKYIVNSGITVGTLLSAYEDFPVYYDALQLDIPESNNTIPDLLDEVLWNLRWMLSMQDADDGGVYHKLTNAKFDAMVMPHEALAPRYVVQKSTAAALNLSAVAAQASRIFKKFEHQLPGLSDSCLHISKEAWTWALKNPKVLYNQDEMNTAFDPDVVTGAYGDRDLSDEFIWAACELYATTKDAQYLGNINVLKDDRIFLPSWNQVRLLGYYTLVRLEKELPPVFSEKILDVKKGLMAFAGELVNGTDKHWFMTVMGKSGKDFIWGSSAVAANQSIALIQAYKISGDKKYLNYALTNLDYLLGRNGTGYSFVTGFGSKTPMHPHHRPSEADGIREPIPGMLAGGPNPHMQDKCTTYPSQLPDEAYTDDVCSYASNEIAINWNAPLVYVTGALEVLQNEMMGR